MFLLQHATLTTNDCLILSVGQVKCKISFASSISLLPHNIGIWERIVEPPYGLNFFDVVITKCFPNDQRGYHHTMFYKMLHRTSFRRNLQLEKLGLNGSFSDALKIRFYLLLFHSLSKPFKTNSLNAFAGMIYIAKCETLQTFIYHESQLVTSSLVNNSRHFTKHDNINKIRKNTSSPDKRSNKLNPSPKGN